MAAKERFHIRENICMFLSGGTVTNGCHHSLETCNLLKDRVGLVFQFVVIRTEKHMEPGEFLFFTGSSLIKSTL